MSNDLDFEIYSDVNIIIDAYEHIYNQLVIFFISIESAYVKTLAETELNDIPILDMMYNDNKFFSTMTRDIFINSLLLCIGNKYDVDTKKIYKINKDIINAGLDMQIICWDYNNHNTKYDERTTLIPILNFVINSNEVANTQKYYIDELKMKYIEIYSIDYLITDLIKILFEYAEKPWLDNKWKSRTVRLFTLIFLYDKMQNINQTKKFIEYLKDRKNNCENKTLPDDNYEFDHPTSYNIIINKYINRLCSECKDGDCYILDTFIMYILNVVEYLNIRISDDMVISESEFNGMIGGNNKNITLFTMIEYINKIL